MDKPVMFNGRLNKDEIDTWLNLLNETNESSSKDHELAKAFLMLQESITFVSSIENQIIGGTSIYRDRTRLAMVLAAVAIKKEFRESVSYQIIKSSMPFFKTVAIRDVDALVSLDGKENTLGFPLSLELDFWTIDIIKRMGFSEVGTIDHCTFVIENENRHSPINWTREFDAGKVNELIWDQSKPMGLTNSLVWLARDFALNRNCFLSVTLNSHVAAVAGFWDLSDSLCISPLITDPSKVNWYLIAESIITEALERGLETIELPLIGEGQQELLRILKNRCSHFSCRKLSLLRKPL